MKNQMLGRLGRHKVIIRNTHHLSSLCSPHGRKRDIVVGGHSASLYPGLQISGMTSEAGGFTLIELLVVVLIIGILAAVALPQYQKAVEKSKATQAITLLKSMAQAAEAYKMANGDYPTQFDELAVEIPWTGTQQLQDSQLADKRSNGEWTLELFNNGSLVYLVSGRLTGKYKGAHFRIDMKYSSAPERIGKLYCYERTDQTIPFTASAGSYCKQIMKATTCMNSTNVVLTGCEMP